MYKKKKVIEQTSEMSDKDYHRKLFGRLFRLQRMINHRKGKISEFRGEIDEVKSQIRELEDKISQIKGSIKDVKTEMDIVRNEISDYRNVIENIDKTESLKHKPNFNVRVISKPKPNEDGEYRYFEGRIRLPMVRGRRGKEITRSYGSFEKVKKKYEMKFGSFPTTHTDSQIEYDIKFKWLLKELEEEWWDGIQLLGS